MIHNCQISKSTESCLLKYIKLFHFKNCWKSSKKLFRKNISNRRDVYVWGIALNILVSLFELVWSYLDVGSENPQCGSSLKFGALWELFESSLINLRALGTIWELFELWMWHNFSSWNESYEKRNQFKSKINFSQDVFADYWKWIAK